MYPISNLFADYLRRYDREIVAKADVNGVEYGRANIIDFSVENALTASEAFEVGTAIPSKLTITLRLKEAVPANARITPYLALSLTGMTWNSADHAWLDTPIPWAGGNTDWLPMGEFYVDSREKVNDVWTFTCYDKLVWADVPYVSALSYPALQQSVWNEICSSLGYASDSSVVIDSDYMIPSAPTGYTKRQMLGFIAGANAASVFAGKDGRLRFKRFNASAAPVIELGQSDYIRVRQTNPAKSYSRVVVTYNTDDDLAYEAGSGDEAHTLYVTNPFATQAMTNALLVALNGLTYMPIEMDTYGYPQMDQGDMMGYDHYEGSSWLDQVTPWADTDIPWNGIVRHATMVLRQTFSYKGGLTQRVASPSESDQQSEFAIEGSLTSQVGTLNKTAVREDRRYYGATITRDAGLIIEREGGGAKAVFNADELTFYRGSDKAIWFDVPSNRYKFAGTLEAVDGVFSGSLSAATGTFAGELQAATGTFSGDLSAAGGTFKGNLQAAGGTFSGDLSAAGGTFSGDLQAAGGTFKGALQAASGTFAGNLSAAGGTFSGNLSAAGGSFTGELVAASGSFSGAITASTITGGTVTGALVQTSLAGNYPRAEMNTVNHLFAAYRDADNHLRIQADYSGAPAIRFTSNGTVLGSITSYLGYLELWVPSLLRLTAPTVRINSWDSLYSIGDLKTLRQELNDIWDALENKSNVGHTHTVSLPNHNHGIQGAVNWGGTFTTS